MDNRTKTIILVAGIVLLALYFGAFDMLDGRYRGRTLSDDIGEGVRGAVDGVREGIDGAVDGVREGLNGVNEGLGEVTSVLRYLGPLGIVVIVAIVWIALEFRARKRREQEEKPETGADT